MKKSLAISMTVIAILTCSLFSARQRPLSATFTDAGPLLSAHDAPTWSRLKVKAKSQLWDISPSSARLLQAEPARIPGLTLASMAERIPVSYDVTHLAPLSLVSIPFISQYQGQSTQNHDCGPASGAMILQAYGKRPGGLTDQQWIVDVRSHSGNSSGDLTFSQLETAIAWYGTGSVEIPPTLSPAPDAQMQEMKNALSGNKPVIALVHGATLGRGSAYGDHFVVVRGFSDDNQYVYVNDPDSRCLSGWIECGGQTTWSYQNFRQACFEAQYGPYGIIVGNGLGGDCPQSGGVILYWNSNYNCDNDQGDAGYRQRLTVGWQNVNDGQFNDKASSVRVPSGWSVRLFANAELGEPSVCFNSDVPDFGTHGNFPGSSISINDNVSSVEVFDNSNCSSGPPSPDHAVQFYKDADYGGGGYCYADSEGNYNSLSDCVGYNDEISSVLLMPGWSVRVFKHENLGVPYKCFTSNDPNFSDDTFSDGTTLNDEMSSFALYHQSSCPPVGSPPNPPSLLSPSNGSTLASNTDIALDWDGSSGATEYYAHLWGGPDIDIDSGWIGSTDWHVGPQWPGTYQWQVKARNSYGESGWSSTWSFTVSEGDTTPPTGQITSPSDGAAIGTCPLTIQADASDTGSGVALVEFHAAYDGSWHHLGDDSSSPFSLNWDCSPVSDQGIWLTIHVWDNAGNEAMDPGGYVDVTLDRTQPSGQVLVPEQGAFLNTDDIYVEAEASDNLGVAQVQFFAWYDGEWHYIDRDVDGSDSYQITWDVSSLSDRSGVTLDALILDRAGNRWDATVSNLTLDRTSPTGGILIQDGVETVTRRQIGLTLSASDANGVTQMRLKNDAAVWEAWQPFAVSQAWTLPSQVGDHTVWVQFRDVAGNVSVAYSDSVTYELADHYIYLPLVVQN